MAELASLVRRAGLALLDRNRRALGASVSKCPAEAAKLPLVHTRGAASLLLRQRHREQQRPLRALPRVA